MHSYTIALLQYLVTDDCSVSSHFFPSLVAICYYTISNYMDFKLIHSKLVMPLNFVTILIFYIPFIMYNCKLLSFPMIIIMNGIRVMSLPM